MKDVYFISGLGADWRLLQYLQLSGVCIHHVRWITPQKSESWESYARRLALQIDQPDPILIGVSMGGMMSIEINKFLKVKKTILISSAKTRHEIPFYFRLLKVFKLHRWLAYQFLTQMGLLFGNWLFGTCSKADKQLLHEIIHDSDETFFRWAWNSVASWKNEFIPENTFHIHGNKDHMLPIWFIKPDKVINGGTHLMVVNKADEISNLLQKLIDEE